MDELWFFCQKPLESFYVAVADRVGGSFKSCEE
jgi:hypothetical protein